MKNILYILFVMVNLNMIGQINTKKVIASCCDIGGRCTGSMYCSACKNCSSCRYCAKNGGSCGVCSVGTRNYKSRKKRKKSNYKNNKKTKTINMVTTNTYLYVSSSSLNLRNGAGSKHKIIVKLTKNTRLFYLRTHGNWIKVKVASSGLIGYVYYKYVF